MDYEQATHLYEVPFGFYIVSDHLIYNLDISKLMLAWQDTRASPERSHSEKAQDFQFLKAQTKVREE